MNTAQVQKEPTPAQIESLSGPALLEFGTSWCGHCRAAQPWIADALAAHPGGGPFNTARTIARLDDCDLGAGAFEIPCRSQASEPGSSDDDSWRHPS